MNLLIEKWDLIIETLRETYSILDVSFKTWIKPLKVYKIEENDLYILFQTEMDDISLN